MNELSNPDSSSSPRTRREWAQGVVAGLFASSLLVVGLLIVLLLVGNDQAADAHSWLELGWSTLKGAGAALTLSLVFGGLFWLKEDIVPDAGRGPSRPALALGAGCTALACLIGVASTYRARLTIDNSWAKTVQVSFDGGARHWTLKPGETVTVFPVPGTVEVEIRNPAGELLERGDAELDGGWSYLFSVQGTGTYSLEPLVYGFTGTGPPAAPARLLSGSGFHRYHVHYDLGEKPPSNLTSEKSRVDRWRIRRLR